jgi:hypothetical protein
MSQDPTTSEVRVSTLVGDRVCIKCHFNLVGQPVVREPVYGMIMVRCPECSTVASLQEYPLLGRWAGRLAAALAALWLLLLIGGIFATAGILFGMSQGNTEMGSARLAELISRRHLEWFNGAPEADKAVFKASFGGQAATVGAYVWIDAAWWSKQDPGSFIKELGGPWRAADWSIRGPLFWSIVVAILLGTVWANFLLSQPRWRLLVFALIPILLAATFVWLAHSSPTTRFAWGGGVVYAIEEARRLLGPWLVGTMLGSAFVAFCVGLMIGRPLMRWLAATLLPPRMIGSLAYLWIAAGKTPPRPPIRR